MNKKFWMSLLLILFFASVSFGQLEKLTIYSSVSIYLHEVVMAIWLVIYAYDQPKTKVLPQIKHSFAQLSFPIKSFLVWTSLSWAIALVSHSSLINPALYSGRIIFYLLFLRSLWLLLKAGHLQLKTLKIGLVTTGCYILYFGLLQYVLVPDTRFLTVLGWDDHYFRLISTILDPGFTGIILLLNTFLLIQTWFQNRLRMVTVSKAFSKAIFYLILATFTLGISLTYSRATYLAYGISAVAAASYFLLKKQKHLSFILLASICLLAISIPLLPRPDGEGVKLERTSTIVSRSTSAQTALSELHSWQWLTGQGLFVSNDHQLINGDAGHNRVPDNWLVMLISGTGIVGTGFFLLALGQIAIKYWSKNIWLWSGILAVLIHGLFNASLVYPLVIIWLGFLAFEKNTITVRNES